MVCFCGVSGGNESRRVALKCDCHPDQKVPACVKTCPTCAMVFPEEEFASGPLGGGEGSGGPVFSGGLIESDADGHEFSSALIGVSIPLIH